MVACEFQLSIQYNLPLEADWNSHNTGTEPHIYELDIGLPHKQTPVQTGSYTSSMACILSPLLLTLIAITDIERTLL